MTFFDRLRERIRATGGTLAVGLNPELARLPTDCREYDYPRRAFNRRIVDATHEHVAAYAVNPAYYEDSAGWTALAETVAYARGRGVPVVLDGKFGEISEVRADLLDSVDAVTVSPFLGRDALAPVLDRDAERSGRDLGAFVVCRTPNRGAADLLDRELASGESLAERVATLTDEWADASSADVGLLVGGSSDDVEVLRERAPRLPFYVVGGARNDPEVAEFAAPEDGTAGEDEEVKPGDAGSEVGLVGVSREVLYAGEPAGRGGRRGQDAYAAAARQSARRLKRQLNRYR